MNTKTINLVVADKKRNHHSKLVKIFFILTYIVYIGFIIFLCLLKLPKWFVVIFGTLIFITIRFVYKSRFSKEL